MSKSNKYKVPVAGLIVIVLVAIGLISFLFVPNSKNVKARTTEIIALNLAKAAYVLTAVEADMDEIEIKEENIQNNLKKLKENPGYQSVTMTYDEVGTMEVGMENGTIAYACANINGYGLGKCSEAILSKKIGS